MKTIKTLSIMMIAALSVMGFTACNSKETPQEPVFLVDLSAADLSYSVDNYWSGCYSEGDFTVNPFVFSHVGFSCDDHESIQYWNGFCPSRVNDNGDHKGDWVNYQWACIPANPRNLTYLVGNSESQVNEDPLLNRKCSIRMSNRGLFNPKYAFATNSSYVYYAAKNGTDFNKAFSSDDNFVLHVVGVRSGMMTAHLQFPMINRDEYLDQWAYITLEPLGTVDEVLFYVDSTQKNADGLLVPAYFCLADFVYNLPSSNYDL